MMMEFRCAHDFMRGECYDCPERRFPSKAWNDGWALGSYSKKTGGRTELGELIHTVKYDLHVTNNLEQRKQAAIQILHRVTEFIASEYPPETRPFDTSFSPPTKSR